MQKYGTLRLFEPSYVFEKDKLKAMNNKYEKEQEVWDKHSEKYMNSRTLHYIHILDLEKYHKEVFIEEVSRIFGKPVNINFQALNHAGTRYFCVFGDSVFDKEFIYNTPENKVSVEFLSLFKEEDIRRDICYVTEDSQFISKEDYLKSKEIQENSRLISIDRTFSKLSYMTTVKKAKKNVIHIMTMLDRYNQFIHVGLKAGSTCNLCCYRNILKEMDKYDDNAIVMFSYEELLYDKEDSFLIEGNEVSDFIQMVENASSY